MSLTQDMAMHLGGVPVAMMLPFYNGGRAIFLDVKNGSDGNSGKTPSKAVKSLAQAYALARNGYNDTIFLLSNTGSTDSTSDYTARLSSSFTWSKNRVHLVGAAAPVGISPRSRIATATGQTAAIDPLITLSGTGCIFANIQFFNGIDAAVAANGINVTGERNYFYRCHIAGMGDASGDNDIASAYSLKLTAASENLFEECIIGLETTPKGANSNSEILIATGSARNRFRKCEIHTFATAATHQFVLAGNNALEGTTVFEDCLFINKPGGGSTTMTEAIEITATQNGRILIAGTSAIFGASKWDNDTTGRVNISTPAASATGGTGVAVA